jgi:4-carboxymuconolactone decarboxylase
VPDAPRTDQLATEAGLNAEIIKALAEGRRPPGMAEPEEAAYDFSLELRRNQSISDATYARVLSNFGEQGIIDMIALTGYYTFLGMVTNTARTPMSGGRTPETCAIS